MLIVRTERLDIVAATPELLHAELASSGDLARLLNATIPSDWPPGEYDRPAIEFFLDRLTETPSAAGWYSWYAIARTNDGLPGTLVAAGGYLGPPDADGTVEVGYSVVPRHQGHSFATELVRALLAHALPKPGVQRVIANTHPENIGSVKVLERCGFAPAGAGREPGYLQYVCERPASQ